MSIITYQWDNTTNPFLLNNTLTAGNQIQPAVTANASGSEYFGAWSDPNFGHTIQARIVGADGKAAPEFTANNSVFGPQADASVAGLADGRFVVAFTDTTTDPKGDVHYRLFKADGSAASGELAVFADTYQDHESDVAALADGGFVITLSRDYGGGNSDVYGRVYNADGSVRAPLVDVIHNANNSGFSSVAGLAGGGFVVAWEESPAAGGDSEIRLRHFDAQGNALDGTGTAGVLIDTGGSINKDVQVAGLPDGGYVVAYTDNGWNQSGTEISVRIFNADGSSRVPGPIEVNRFDLGADNTGDQNHPTLTVMPNGMFVVGWSTPNGGYEHLQAFDSNGNALAHNVGIGVGILETSIAALSEGRVAAVFSENFASDGSGTAIYSSVHELSRVITGNPHISEVLVGANDGLKQFFSAGDGNDTMIASAAIDSFDGGDGFDAASYENAPKAVMASLLTPGVNTGFAAGDIYHHVEGLIGSALPDTLEGDGNANFLDGRGGSDLMAGHDGNDTYVVDNPRDVVIEKANEGTDKVTSMLADYTLPDNVDLLALSTGAIKGTGNDLNNIISGNAANNTLSGAGGDDVINGGGGNDVLDGDAGADRAIFSGAHTDYRVDHLSNGDFQISDLRAGAPDGIDTLHNIEMFEFSDATMLAPPGSPPPVGSPPIAVHAPVIDSNGGGDSAAISIHENTTAVTGVTATDADAGTTLSYAIVGGDDAGKFKIDASSGALSFVAAPDHETPTDANHDNSYVVQVRASDGSLTDDQTVTVNVTQAETTAQTHWMASVDLGQHPGAYTIAGVGDFNGDGTSDLAWFDAASGNLDVWELANGQWSASASPGTHPAGYQPVGFGDFNHDGTSDALWFNPTTNDVDIWKIADGKLAGSVDVGTHPAGSQIAGIGDFNGDGTSDVLWVNPANNDVEVWQMADSQWAGSVDIGTHPGGSQIAGVGDFNGDGTSDVLWVNPLTNDAEVWQISNSHWAASVDIGTHPAGSQIAGVGDFNDDGTSDVMWFDAATGGVDLWEIENSHWAGSANPGSHPLGAIPVGIGDFNHDGASEIMWHDVATGHIDEWLLTNG